MKFKRIVLFLVALFTVLNLTGCSIFTIDTEQLITPPELTGDMYPIYKALTASIKEEYQLKYPSLGEHRSAIILEDINGDGRLEAFAFYSTSGDEMTNMHINAISRSGDTYKSIADQSIVAGGVEKVDFCDLDGDGTSEILVGWEVYGSSEKQLCVYSLSGETLSQRFTEKYTGFLCCDLTDDGQSELFVHSLNTADMVNSAAVYRFTEGGFEKIGGCVLDSMVKTVSETVYSKLSTGKSAVYIDEIKGAGAVTEVLFFEDGELKNPLLDTESTIENIRTLRAASIQSRDIDGDGIIEIPVATNLPNAADKEELLFYTNWCVFGGENLTTKRITIVNTIDGYYLEIPENLAGRIAVLKDTDKHRRVFYLYDAEHETVGERIATITVISADEWDSEDYNRMNMFELARSGDKCFIGSINLTANSGLSEKELKNMFKITG